MLIQHELMIEVKEENIEENIKDLFKRLVEEKVALQRLDNKNNGVFYFYNESKKELEDKLIEKYFKKKEIDDVLKIWQEAGADKISIQSSNSLNTLYKIEVPRDKDERYLYVKIKDIDSDNETVVVLFTTKYEEFISSERDFTLTWYDFPFTDYSILPKGMRFSLILDEMKIDDDTSNYIVNLKIIWYPKDYFTAHERPINYKEFREKLGIAD